jgi:hypothetical protein
VSDEVLVLKEPKRLPPADRRPNQARPETNADKIIDNIKKRLRVAGVMYRE